MPDEKQIQVCQKHTLPEEVDVVIREPYLPYVPENWNGLLVLAEAQNLSKTNEEYVSELRGMSSDDLYFRLSDPADLGIMPWDDGSLKLAVEAAFSKSDSPVKAAEVAASR